MFFANGYQTNEVVLMGTQAYVRVTKKQAKTLYNATTLYICPMKYSISNLEHLVICNHWLSKDYITGINKITFDDEVKYLEDRLDTKALKFYIAFDQDNLMIES